MNKINLTTIDLTIIMPVYNKEYSVALSLQSIISQTIKPKRIIIIDDGSSDNSLHICKKFIEDNKSKFNNFDLITRENKGVSYSRNQGLSMVNSKYVTFLDADDEFLAGYLEKRSKDFRKIESDIYSGAHFINEKAVINPFMKTSGFVSNPFLFSMLNSILNSSKVIFDLSKIQKEDLYFPLNVVKGEDLYLWLKLMNKYKIYYDNKPYIKINYTEDFSREKRKFKLPYPVIKYKEFCSYPLSCKLYIHSILLKDLRKNFKYLSKVKNLEELLKDFPYLRFLLFIEKLLKKG